MKIKKLFIFPAVSMGLVLMAMIFGIAAVGKEIGEYADIAMYVLVALACLIPFCLHTVSLVGSLRNNVGMIIVGSCIVLFLSYAGNAVLAGSCMETGNRIVKSFVWVFFGMTVFTSIMMSIAGLTSISKKGNSPFLMVAAILAILFYIGFAITVTAAQSRSLVAFTSVFFTASFLVVLGSMLAVSILGIQGKTQVASVDDDPEQPGLTHAPKNLRGPKAADPTEELLKWKKLLDAGAISQDDYDKKKEEILSRY